MPEPIEKRLHDVQQELIRALSRLAAVEGQAQGILLGLSERLDRLEKRIRDLETQHLGDLPAAYHNPLGLDKNRKHGQAGACGPKPTPQWRIIEPKPERTERHGTNGP